MIHIIYVSAMHTFVSHLPCIHCLFILCHALCQISQVAQWQRVCLTMQETPVQSLGQEDPMGKEMATHSSVLAWEIPWTESGAWWARVHSVVRRQTQLNTHSHILSLNKRFQSSHIYEVSNSSYSHYLTSTFIPKVIPI